MTTTSPISIATVTAVAMFLVIWALAAGFDVDVMSAFSRALPLVLIGAAVSGFATAVLRHELA